MTLVNMCKGGCLPDTCGRAISQPLHQSTTPAPRIYLGFGCNAFSIEMGHNLPALVMLSVICGSNMKNANFKRAF